MDIIAQLPTICLLQVHHDVAIYITFQLKLLPDSFSEGQIFIIFLGGMPPDPLARACFAHYAKLGRQDLTYISKPPP